MAQVNLTDLAESVFHPNCKLVKTDCTTKYKYKIKVAIKT